MLELSSLADHFCAMLTVATRRRKVRLWCSRYGGKGFFRVPIVEIMVAYHGWHCCVNLAAIRRKEYPLSLSLFLMQGIDSFCPLQKGWKGTKQIDFFVDMQQFSTYVSFVPVLLRWSSSLTKKPRGSLKFPRVLLTSQLIPSNNHLFAVTTSRRWHLMYLILF